MTEMEEGREILLQTAESTSCAALEPHILPGRQDSALLMTTACEKIPGQKKGLGIFARSTI